MSEPKFKVGDKVKMRTYYSEEYDIVIIDEVRWVEHEEMANGSDYSGYVYDGHVSEYRASINSKWADGKFADWPENLLENPKCSCDLICLMQRGCTCGGV